MKKLFVPLLALTLAGCGFHLRRPLDLPMDIGPVRVVTPDAYSPLGEALAEAMMRAGAAAPADDSARSGVARLEILSERWGSLPLSLDAYGRNQESSLRYAVVFTLFDASGRQVVPQQVVELSRDYISTSDNVIGTDGERELLAREMRREMVTSILRRIATATRPHQDAGQEQEVIRPPQD